MVTWQQAMQMQAFFDKVLGMIAERVQMDRTRKRAA
jgi:hypothetical protein